MVAVEVDVCGSELATQVNVPFTLLPRRMTAAMMATAMRATRRPYSTAAAPRSAPLRSAAMRACIHWTNWINELTFPFVLFKLPAERAEISPLSRFTVPCLPLRVSGGDTHSYRLAGSLGIWALGIVLCWPLLAVGPPRVGHAT